VSRAAASTLRLTAATAGAAPLIARVTLAAYEEYRETLVPPSGVFSESLADVRAELARGGAVIVSLNATPAGCARYEPGPERAYLYVGRISVLPEYRGHGLAGALLGWLEARAVALAIPELQLGVRLNLPRNIDLYLRHGYQVFGYEDLPGHGRVSAWMRKCILPSHEGAGR